MTDYSVLGTLPGGTPISPPFITLSDLLTMNSSVQRTLRDVIKKEMLLEFKFENILDLIRTLPSEPVLLEEQTFTFTGEIQTVVVPPRASIQGDFAVTPGELLTVLVGGQGRCRINWR